MMGETVQQCNSLLVGVKGGIMLKESEKNTNEFVVIDWEGYIRLLMRSIVKSEKQAISESKSKDIKIKWGVVEKNAQGDATLIVGDLQVGVLISNDQLFMYSVDNVSKLPKKYQSPFLRIEQDRLCFQQAVKAESSDSPTLPDSQSLHLYFEALRAIKQPAVKWVRENGGYHLTGVPEVAYVFQDKPLHVIREGKELPKLVRGVTEDLRTDKTWRAKQGKLLPVWQLVVGEKPEAPEKIVYTDDANSAIVYANQTLPSLQADGPAT